MTHNDLIDLALEYGAMKPHWHPTTHPGAWSCWADRIEMLPLAAVKGEAALAEAITEANRYSGHRNAS